MEDRLEEIRPCICCHNGCFNLAHYKGHANAQSFFDTRGMARCAINPQTMQSKKYKIQPAPKTKSVAVVGGGVAGMEAAIVCARRGHQVTLYEKPAPWAAYSRLRLRPPSRKRTKSFWPGTAGSLASTKILR